MKITVLSKRNVRIYSPMSNAAIIRISSQYPLVSTKGNYIYSLELFFDDITYGNEDLENISNIISSTEAIEIINFVKIIHNCSELVVHCDYGKGRSPAVAAAIADILNINFNKSLFPQLNKLVYDKIINLK